MTRDCLCTATHSPRMVVVTGGPGAGKTAVVELARRSLCDHVHVVREAAGIVFGGGFPRTSDPPSLRAAQRAIFYVQRELEGVAILADAAIVLCDRGTVDGGAYWPGPGDLWSTVGTTLAAQLARYAAVIHLRTPSPADYNHQNPLRVESALEAAAIDARIAATWSAHPHYVEVASDPSFVDKAARAIAILRTEVPMCCRGSTTS